MAMQEPELIKHELNLTLPADMPHQIAELPEDIFTDSFMQRKLQPLEKFNLEIRPTNDRVLEMPELRRQVLMFLVDEKMIEDQQYKIYFAIKKNNLIDVMKDRSTLKFY